ncbi:hypothetical protein CDV55_100496 [Aspergillus turcosus]|nr:hypothetical protein CDV55_100496 [Aspergillus turcosus]
MMHSLTPDDYTIAWICALPVEAAAARAMLDKTHTPPRWSTTDPNAYEFGELSGHYIVIAHLPDGVYGKVSAAAVVSRMRSTFRRLEFGDVVVSKPGPNHNGVIQYDYGKAVPGGKFEQTGILNKPPQILLRHMSQFRARQMTGAEDAVSKTMAEVLERNPNLRDRFSHPEENTDFLFRSSYRHVNKEDTCGKCDKEQLVKRPLRDTRTPYIHYGLIASGDQVMKDSEIRDCLAQQHEILCFEMEAAGLMDELPTLVIRGICDYCDSHKNKKWQGYAALAAAAYAKVFLSGIPGPPVISIDTKLQEYYEMDNRLRIKRLSGDFLDMEQCYINLSIIEYQNKNQDTKSQAERRSSGFSLLNRLKITADTPEREVTLPDLFRDRKLPDGQMIQPRRILIRGRAGVGKTTLCKKIVHDFYHKQMWETLFDRVIWIPLRRLKGMSSLDEFFRREYFSFQAERDKLVSKLWKTDVAILLELT